MKKAIIITLLAFCFFDVLGQNYNYNATQYEFNRLMVKSALGIPEDTFAIPLNARHRPHLAIKNEVLYRWSVPLQKFVIAAGTSIDTLIMATRARLKHVIDSLSFTHIDSLWEGEDKELVYRKGGVAHSLPGAFQNFYNYDGGFDYDRYVVGNGYSLNFNGLREFNLFINNPANKTYSEFRIDPYTFGMKYGYSDPAAIGTKSYNSFGHIVFNPLNEGRSNLKFYAMYQTGVDATTRRHHHLSIAGDSILFEAFSNENTRRGITLKAYGMPVTTSGTVWNVVWDSTTKVFSVKAAATVTTPTLQQVLNAGNTATNTMTTGGYNTTTNLVQIMETDGAGGIFFKNTANTKTGFVVGDLAELTHYRFKQTTASNVIAIGYGGVLFSESADGARPYWMNTAGVAKKFAFTDEITGGGGGSDPAKQNYSDTATTDATRHWVNQQKYRVAHLSTALTDAPTIVWDFSTGDEKTLVIGGNRTLSITNLPTDRDSYGGLAVTQDATGGRTLALPTGSKVVRGGGGVVTLTTTGGARDILYFHYSPSTGIMDWVLGSNSN